MKAGRNDDCPCGSQQKFKNCCLPKQEDERTGNRLFREMEASLIELLLPFADETFGEESINQALGLFLDTDDLVEYEQDDPLNTFFLPWFVFNWFVEEEDEKPSPEAPLHTTIAEAYLAKEGKNLAPDMVDLIHASNRRPLSFYEIKDIVPGKGLKLYDLLRQSEIDVAEDSASSSLRKNEIIIASTVRPMTDKIRPLIIGPFSLKAKEKQRVEELRGSLIENTKKELLDDEALLNQEAFVIGLYLDILDEMLDEEEDLIPQRSHPNPHRR